MAQRTRTFLVTGASRGLGRAIALELAREGGNLVVAARTRDALERTAADARAAGASATLVLDADLASPDEPARVVDAAVERFGGLDVLVNNAGATKRGDFLELTDADHLDGFALKYHGTVRFCRAAWPHLVAAGGVVVNISGIGAQTPDAEFTVGGPVNSALLNFTKALAKRALAEGVRVNALCPGHIVTDRLQARIDAHARATGLSQEQARESLRQQYGIDRFGDAADIAGMVAYLCSDRAGYVHGSTLVVDGGATPGL